MAGGGWLEMEGTRSIDSAAVMPSVTYPIGMLPLTKSVPDQKHERSLIFSPQMTHPSTRKDGGLILMTMASVLAFALPAISARVGAAPVYSVPCEDNFEAETVPVRSCAR